MDWFPLTFDDYMAVDRWDHLDGDARRRTCELIVDAVPGLVFTGQQWCSHPIAGGELRHAVARFRFADRELVLIPGGQVALGLAGDLREVLARVAPAPSFARFDAASVIAQLAHDPEQAGASFTPARTVRLAAFLCEIDTVPFATYPRTEHDWIEEILESAGRPPWQLPTPDEWEHLYSAGTRTVFPWGDVWPGTPGCSTDPADWVNAYGVHFSEKTECTDEPYLLCGGDPDGWNLNGFDGRIVHASAYLTLPTHIRYFPWEAYAASGVRRIIRIP
jgi:hypothetical protein